jgi:lipid-binding SYLF domain-containing protein
MSRFMTVVVSLVLASTGLDAAKKEQDRLEDAGLVIEEILAIDDNIPQDLLDKAECVIVIPSMLKVALGIGGSYGRGAMVCRTGPLAGRRRIWCRSRARRCAPTTTPQRRSMDGA